MGLNSVHAFIQTRTRARALSLTLSSHIQVSSAHMTANILPAGPFHTLKSTEFSASLHFLHHNGRYSLVQWLGWRISQAINLSFLLPAYTALKSLCAHRDIKR